MAAKKKPVSSRAKLKKFQKKAGLDVTGRYDSETRRNLKLARKGKPLQTAKAKTARRKSKADQLANDPAQITQPLTPKLLDQEIKSQTALKYGGQERQIQDEQRVSDAMHPRIDSYYQDYLSKIGQIQQQQAQQQAATVGQIDQLAGRDQASSGSAEAQQALQARQALSRSFGSLTATQGQNAQNQWLEQQRIGSQRQVLAHADENNRAANIRAKLQALAAEKGDYASSLRTQARSSERNFGLQQAALGQKTEEAAAQQKLAKQKARVESKLASSLIGDRKADNRRQSKSDKRKARLQRRQQNITAANNRRTNATSRANAELRASTSGKGKGGKGGMSAGDKSRVLKGRSQITQAKAAYSRSGGKYGDYINGGTKKGYPLPVLHAGYELNKQGYIGPHTVRELKQLGISVPSAWRRKPSAARTAASLVGRIKI